MAQPASRQDLIDYALRQNGAPVLEINVAEEQLPVSYTHLTLPTTPYV